MARKEFLVFGAPKISEDEIAEVVAVLRSGWIGTGPRCIHVGPARSPSLECRPDLDPSLNVARWGARASSRCPQAGQVVPLARKP